MKTLEAVSSRTVLTMTGMGYLAAFSRERSQEP
jgi:hypothetical protein